MRSSVLMRWAAVGVVVGLPLVVDPWGFAPFGPVKWLLASVLVMALAVGLLVDRRIVGDTRWAAGWLVFLVWGAVVSLVAVDPVYTWIGTPDRHLGWFAWLLFAVAFFAGMRLAASRDHVRSLLNGASVALAGIGAYAVLELLGIPPVELAVDSSRPGGPFGSAAYLGAACALLLPVALGAAVDGLGSLRWRVVAWAAVALGSVAAIASQTRAGWVGLAAALVIALPAVWPWLRARRAIVAGLLVVGALVVVVTPVGGRLASAVDFVDGGARGRIDEWRVGAQVLTDNPVTGLGFEGYRIGFGGSVDADYERRYGRVVTPDRAHSGFLDVGVTTGLVGMVLYAAGAVALVMTAWHAARRRQAWLVGLAAGVAGYTVQQQFLFPLAELDPAFWLLAGVLVVASGAPVRAVRVPPGLWLLPLAVGVAALVAGGLDVAADHATDRAVELEAAGDRVGALEAADDATGLRPDSIRYAFVAASIAARAETPDGLRVAIDRLDDGLRISPEDPILLARRASVRLDLARAERDPIELGVAVAEWETLVDRDPNHSQYRLELGIAYAAAGRVGDAEAQWLAAADLAPESTAPPTNLASLYLAEGRTGDAATMIARVRALDPEAPLLPELERRLAEATES